MTSGDMMAQDDNDVCKCIALQMGDNALVINVAIYNIVIYKYS